MAKNDNLKDFLTDVADAIREKKGTTEKINPQDFSSEIKGIESGGGIVPCEWNDVNFYDYDGTILHSYTWDEFVEKNEMPPLPTHHKGLVCQEWNYTLEEVLEQGGRCDVGAIYIPSDGNTHIKIQHGGNVEYHICFSASEIGGVTIDWGDGGSTTNNSTSVEYYSHLYNNGGKYDISISVNKGTISSFAIKSNLSNLRQDIIGVYIGKGVKSIGNDAFRYTSMSIITIPNSTLIIGERVFHSTRCRHINIPRDIASYQVFEEAKLLETYSVPNTPIKTSKYYFSSTSSLKHMYIPSNFSFDVIPTPVKEGTITETISSSVLNNDVSTKGNVLVIKGKLIRGCNSSVIPQDITSIEENAFTYKGQLIEAIIPDTCTTIGGGAFNYCCGLKRLRLPEGLTVINQDSFANLYSLRGVLDIPPSVSNIAAYAFISTSHLDGFNFSRHTSIPTLSSTTALNATGTAKIVVPDALYEDWIKATNWATYASRIVKASDTYIEFVDPVVAQICADKWGDGVGITYNQAAAVSSVGAVFKANKNISYFNEFRYFTRLNNIAYEGMHSTSLEEVTLPKNLTILNDYCFAESQNLKIVKIESSKITSVGMGAFRNCSNLETFLLPVTTPPTLIHVTTFYNCQKLSIYVPDDSVEAYKSATNWSDFASKIKPMSEYV